MVAKIILAHQCFKLIRMPPWPILRNAASDSSVISPSRALIGVVLAAGVAVAARRWGALQTSGAWGAMACGALSVTAGGMWMVALLTFFGSSTVLSRWRRDRKEQLTRNVVEKPGARDLTQVAANGGVFAVCALLSLLAPSPVWMIAGLGSLAAATADTWATEVGTAIGGTPRMIFGFAPVVSGTSGAVTLAGTAAMTGGAITMGTVGWIAGFDPGQVFAVWSGGVTGALVDTLVGATIQERRWCGTCQCGTEQRVHRCGTLSVPSGGLAFMTNDTVNLTSTLTGALTAVAVARLVA